MKRGAEKIKRCLGCFFCTAARLLVVVAAVTYSTAAEFSLRQSEIQVRQIDMTGALAAGPLYPEVRWENLNFNSPTIVTSNHLAFSLKNEQVELIVLPRLGKIQAIINRQTGHNQLWTNPVARPIKAHNDTGWWMVWGGIEFTIPRGEHGTTWSLPWTYNISHDSARIKAIAMEVREPATGLKQEIEVSLRPNSFLAEVDIKITNTSSTNVPFAHWTNPMLAPGGRNELTPRTELVVPCTAMLVPDRDFTRWMGDKRQNFETSKFRFIENWSAPGDLLAESLTHDFFGAFSHEANEGIVRIADRRITPGMDIWTWGYPPPQERQKEYSLAPNLGYVEMWGGTATNYTDEARAILRPSQKMQWKEFFAPFHGTGGLNYADTNMIVGFTWSQDTGRVSIGIFPLKKITSKFILHQSGKFLASGVVHFPKPFLRTYDVSKNIFALPNLDLNVKGQPRLRLSPTRALDR